MAETSGGGSRRMGVAPARVPRAEYGINDLHRDVLLRVLSRLDARQVVRTCVLSQLWRDVPCINTTRNEFGDHDDPNYNDRNPLFKKFVNHLLMRRNPVGLDEFRLLYSIGPELEAYCAEANLWIGHALPCRARSVQVFPWGPSGVRKLDFYFEQKELTMVKNVQWCPKFNNLKFLTLDEWCLDADFYALIVFLQNSPNLERLTLDLNQNFYELGIITGELEERSFTCEHLTTVEIICSEHYPAVDSLKEFFAWEGHSLWSDSHKALEAAPVIFVSTTGTNHCIVRSFIRGLKNICLFNWRQTP